MPCGAPSMAMTLVSPSETGLGGGVVGLERLAEQPRRRGDEHEAAVALRLHHAERGLAQMEAAVEVHAAACAASRPATARRRARCEDARVAHDRIEATEAVDRGVERSPLRPRGCPPSRATPRPRRPPARSRRRPGRRRRVRAVAVHRAAEVVDHHGRAAPRQIERVEAARDRGPLR